MTSPRILATGTATPPHVLRQADARAFAQHHFAGTLDDLDRLLTVFDHAEIETRHTCMPLEWFRQSHDFEEKNAAYVDWALRLSSEAIANCLQETDVTPRDIDYLIFVSTTGLATPSIDARLIGALGFHPNTRRTPVWGLGCAGGAAGLAHAFHHAQGHPRAHVLVVALELCSLTFHFGDRSKSNLVAAALFGDGAAAVLVSGDQTHGDRAAHPEIMGTMSTLWPDSLDVMGWNVMNEGMQVVFAQTIPAIVRRLASDNIVQFLESFQLGLTDIDHLIAHPGGARVISAYEQALALSDGRMDSAREVLREYGNMSSASVLFVLKRFLRPGRTRPGEHGLVTALGPGFCSENVLVRF
jgi:alkylresorcinol/alkylpyrone synthase